MENISKRPGGENRQLPEKGAREAATPPQPVGEAPPPRDEEPEERIDRLLRALAEAENARQRAERTAAEAKQFAVGDFVRELLPVADNLERALAAVKPTGHTEEDPLVAGVQATLQLLGHVLERRGVKKIAAMGEPFDPRLHEAVMAVEDKTRPPGTILGVVEEGYMINGRLLRPARVFVNSPNAMPETAQGNT